MGIWLNTDERESLARAVSNAWPELNAPSLTWLAEGFGSAAFESEDGIVVLVAKNEMGAQSRRVTCVLTPKLAPRLAVAVPVPLWSLDSGPGLPFGAYAYRKLPGRKMTPEDTDAASDGVEESLGAFLHAMHAVPVYQALAVGLPDFDEFWADLVSLRATTDRVLRDRLTPEEYAVVQAWWDEFLGDEALARAPRCLVHGDLWPHNMLVDEQGRELLGVIDFGDVNVIDAAYDFAPLCLSRKLLDGVLTAYEKLGGVVDDAFEHRLKRWWQLRSGSWFSLRAAIRTDDSEELADALGELRGSTILSSAGIR